MEELGFPWWIRGTHLLTIIFMSYLIRSGLQILSSHPKLYWNDDCQHGSEWLRVTSKEMPKDKLWTSQDEEEDYSSWLAEPGHDNLGLGRQWHFINVLGFILTGVVYVALLFLDWPQWTRLVPTSWEVIPGAFRNFVTYLSFELPPIPAGEEYNYLQQLAYGGAVFLLAPFTIVTGALMSPALAARHPHLIGLIGGHQAARSLHFLSLLAWLSFIFVHVFMVVVHGFGHETAKMIFGAPVNREAAVVITVSFLVALVFLHVATTKLSLRFPRRVQHALLAVVGPVRRALLRRVTSAQDYSVADISPTPRVNGRPPAGDGYKRMAENSFEDYRLEIGGLVERPRSFSLEELRTFPTVQTQRTLRPGLDVRGGVDRGTSAPARRVVRAQAGGPLPRFPRLAERAGVRAGTQRPRRVLRDHRLRAHATPPDHPRLRDEW